MKFSSNFFPSFCSFLGVSKPPSKLKLNMFNAGDEHFCCWRLTLLVLGGELVLHWKCFSAGDEHIENPCSNFSHSHTASYQQLSNRTYMYLEMIATHNKYSPSVTGGSYHTLVLTSEYAPPTSYTCMYTIALPAGLNRLHVD